MRPTRLFVGGLGDGVDRNMLIDKLSMYGSVSNAEVKEKKDAEGFVSMRFAYVNLEATQDQVEKCVHLMNGSMWHGSRLRVEVARESFLDRLKREREEAQGNHHHPPSRSWGNDDTSRQNRFANDDTSRQNRFANDNEQSENRYKVYANEKRKRNFDATEAGVVPTDFDMPSNRDDNDNEAEPARRKMKKRNEQEEDMLASFKTFSSVWADSDEDDDQLGYGSVLKISNKQRKELEEKSNERREFMDDESVESDSEDDDETGMQDKRQNWGSLKIPESNKEIEENIPDKAMTRYDPTLEEHQQFRTEALEDLANAKVPEKKKDSAVESACHKLFAMFNVVQLEDPENTPELPPIKKQSFFRSLNDEGIQEGINWMMENRLEKVREEFKQEEEKLFEIVKMRSVRARKDVAKKLDKEDEKQYRRPGKKNEVGSCKINPLSLLEEQNYDHAWRLAEKIQFKNGQDTGEENTRGWGSGSDGFRGRGRGQGNFRGRGEGNFRGRGRGEGNFRGRGEGNYRGRGGWGSRGNHYSGERGDISSDNQGNWSKQITSNWGEPVKKTEVQFEQRGE